MSTTPTRLPVPSEKPQDLKFNSGKIDEFVTSLQREYEDRFGNKHYTIEGLRWVAQKAIAAFGYITLKSFQLGAPLPNNALTLPNQVLQDETDGEYYRWDGAFPKVVPAGSTPDSTGGKGLGAWVGVGDAALRTEIFNQYIDWVTPDSYFIAGEADYTGAFQRVLAVSRHIRLLGKTYPVNADIIVTTVDDVSIIGEGSEQSKIVATSAGAALVKLAGTGLASVRNRISVQGVTLDGAGLVTNTMVTCAAQSPKLIDDVVVIGGIGDGFVHTRGWSTFARGLVCKNNGGRGMVLAGDNNNTHWEGMWSDNGSDGIYIRNAAVVTIRGGVEGNAGNGARVTATATITSGFVNTVSSIIDLSDVYFENNGGTNTTDYAQINLGGDDGIVRDITVNASHIGINNLQAGLRFRQNVVRPLVIGSAFYNVTGSPTAHVVFSGAYTSLASIITSIAPKFINSFLDPKKVVCQGFTDTNNDAGALLQGGGVTKATANALEVVLTSGDNLSGTSIKRLMRGTSIIRETGIKANTQVWDNASDPAGLYSLGVGGAENLRIATNGFTKLFKGAMASAGGTYHEMTASVDSAFVASTTNLSATAPSGHDFNFPNVDPNNTTSWFLRGRAAGSNKFFVYSNGNIQNLNNSYGGISDGRLKDKVTDANSAWDEFLQYRFVNYYLKTDLDTKLLGVISQEIQEISPGLVHESPEIEYFDTGEVDEEGAPVIGERATGRMLQSVAYSVLYLKACITLQEAMHKIEEQGRRIEALEEKLSGK